MQPGIEEQNKNTQQAQGNIARLLLREAHAKYDLMEEVVLVDREDNIVGTMEKMEAHQKGMLHRAFSIVLFNAAGDILLQQRSLDKYHSGGLWTNTCCSHPRPGERIEEAARRKLFQEMGIDLQPEFVYKFIYRAQLDHGLIEHEYDHVFTGIFNGTPAINADEVADWKFMSLQAIQNDMALHPGHYTFWFREIIHQPEFGALLTA